MEFAGYYGRTATAMRKLLDPEERRKTVADWKRLAAQFDAFADELAPAGMRVGYHSHNVEFTPLDGTTPWDIFFGGTKKSVIQQVDIGNGLDGGGDPVALIKRFPGRTVTTHLKELSKTKPDAFVGEGDVPWKAVFEACETVGGTEWYIGASPSDWPPDRPSTSLPTGHRPSSSAINLSVSRWSGDGRSLFLARAGGWPCEIHRLDLASEKCGSALRRRIPPGWSFAAGSFHRRTVGATSTSPTARSRR